MKTLLSTLFVLTNSGSIVPKGAIPIVGYIPSFVDYSENWTFQFKALNKNYGAINPESPPEGKIYIITSIFIRSRYTIYETSNFRFEISPTDIGTYNSDEFRSLYFDLTPEDSRSYAYTSKDPIWILTANDRLFLSLRNNGVFKVRGWMVDE